MANYKDIKGGTVQNFAGDPPAPIKGQVWYDSTNRDFHYRSEVTTGTWSTGRKFKFSKTLYTRSRNSNSCFRFCW